VTGRWALAFAVAAVIALAGAALLRARSRRGASGVRQRGALAIAVGGLFGWVFLPELSGRIVVIAVATMALALLGATFAEREPPRGARLGALTAAAVMAVAAGVRLEWSGLAALDVAGTVAVIVVVAIALRWFAASDGLAPAMTGASLAGVFALGAFGHQDALATLAAATGGACLGFLAYNFPPASVYVNKDGALFLGFLVAVLAIDVQPAIGRPGSLAVPLLLLAVPLLEITLVPLGQLRRRKRVGPGRRDHLVHRLRALGLGRRTALVVLFGVQLSLSGIAVFVGRGVLTPLAGLALGASIAAIIGIAACVKDVYGGGAVPGFSTQVKLLVLGLFALAALLAVPAGIAAARTRNSVDNARRLVQQGIDAARRGDAKTAQERFTAAGNAFDNVRDSLDNPLVLPSRALPVVGANVHATRELASIGADLARTGEQTAARVDPDRLQVVNGTVPLDQLRRVTPDFERAARQLGRAVRRLDSIDDAFLVSPVSKALGKVDREVTAASHDADDAVTAARLAPAIFGGEGTRRYFLAVQNGAEWRATGGFIGNWGILTSEGGKVHLDHFERIGSLNPSPGESRVLHAPEEYARRYQRFFPGQAWQNINMSPDFPTTAQIMTDQYREATGEQVDGILAVDPEGLAALLRLTGPVSVAGWPEPLSEQNVVRVTLNDAYIAFPQGERVDFLGDVAHAVMDRVTSEPLGKPAKIARVLGRSAREGHLILAFTRPEEQQLAVKLHVAGKVPAVNSDSLFLTTQNAGANKIDYYLRRHLTYAVRLKPNAGVANLNGRVDVTLDNSAPDAGLPAYVIGPGAPGVVAGENRTFASVYTPLELTAATFEGNPQPLDPMTELGRNVYAAFLSVPARTSRTLSADVKGTVRLDQDGRYTLDLFRQPGITPDDVSVTIQVPPGWRLVDGQGFKASGGRQATAHLQLDQTTRLRVRLAPDTANVWQRLLDGQ
jgi:UDP-N-acetylmuramyl pentapeptide phosphotransferase/UDP-N-acetylglucosamine-1-phosphate transferase